MVDAATLALQRVRSRHAPDGRVSLFDVTLECGGDGVSVSGVVEDERVRTATVEAVAAASEAPVVDDLRVPRPVAASATASTVPVRAAPDGDAEQVTQILYGAEAVRYDRRGEWSRVRGPDGHVGWADSASLCRCHHDADGVFVRDVEPEGGSDALPDTLFAGTPCRVVDGSTGRVRFPTGAEASVPPDAVRVPEGRPRGERVVETARRFLGTDYEWGGMSSDGVDCSGLVWVAYRVEGIRLPRDTDQQERMGREVDLDSLQAGDLLFFPGHVAVSLGGKRFVHADGDDGVVEASLDPADEGFAPERAEGFRTARRLVPD